MMVVKRLSVSAQRSSTPTVVATVARNFALLLKLKLTLFHFAVFAANLQCDAAPDVVGS